MKKLIQIVAAVVVSAGFFGNVVNAATCDGDITIVNSGSNNNVTITCNDIQSVTITCNNNVTTANFNYQNGQTGSAVVTGNGSNYSTSTGDVINSNDTSVTIDASCNGTTTTSPTPTPSTSVTPTPSTTPPAKAASLPNTATNDTASIVAISLAAAAGVVGLSRAAVAAYRRIGNK